MNSVVRVTKEYEFDQKKEKGSPEKVSDATANCAVGYSKIHHPATAGGTFLDSGEIVEEVRDEIW